MLKKPFFLSLLWFISTCLTAPHLVLGVPNFWMTLNLQGFSVIFAIISVLSFLLLIFAIADLFIHLLKKIFLIAGNETQEKHQG